MWKACKPEFALPGELVELPPVGVKVLTQQRVRPDPLAEVELKKVLVARNRKDSQENREAILKAFPELAGVPTLLPAPSAIVSMWRKSDTDPHDGWASDAFPMHLERLPTHWDYIPQELA